MESICPRVNGSNLPANVGRVVSFVGEVLNNDVSGYNALLRAPDGLEVNITLPVGEQLETRHVHVIGKVISGNAIEVHRVKSLNVESECDGKPFDMALYNKTLELVTGKYSHLF